MNRVETEIAGQCVKKDRMQNQSKENYIIAICLFVDLMAETIIQLHKGVK